MTERSSEQKQQSRLAEIRWESIKPTMKMVSHMDADEQGDFQRDLERIFDAGRASASTDDRALMHEKNCGLVKYTRRGNDTPGDEK